jgi:hypothetical protein
MLQASRDVLEFTRGVSEGEYGSNKMLQMAVERGFQILGEAARRISESFKTAHPEIPWSAIVGHRNVTPGFLQVEVQLESQPESLGGTEISCQAERGVRGDGPLSEDDLIHPPRRCLDLAGQLVLADAPTRPLQAVMAGRLRDSSLA